MRLKWIEGMAVEGINPHQDVKTAEDVLLGITVDVT
jgi:hypothetical protein